tara:strand:+ start:2470 stop:3240 length:771 start_codon:yes stop_codon:yes gene_type:complete
MKKYLCHVDFFGLFNLFEDKFIDKNLINVFYAILEELEIDIIYLATFNYDFLRIGKTKYGAISQLNEITRIIQKDDRFKQTFDPVFSFCTNDKDYKFKLVKNFESFGKDSLYGYALDNNIEYLNLGTTKDFISTGIHYAEKFFDVKYRYKKKFIGEYYYKNKVNKIIYNHCVWPLTQEYCRYDASKINTDLIKEGIWEVIRSKNGFFVMKSKINLFNQFIKDRVEKDPFYPVHFKTKEWMNIFIKDKKSISLENFE